MTARLDGCEDVWQIMVPFCMSCSIIFWWKFMQVPGGKGRVASSGSAFKLCACWLGWRLIFRGWTWRFGLERLPLLFGWYESVMHQACRLIGAKDIHHHRRNFCSSGLRNILLHSGQRYLLDWFLSLLSLALVCHLRLLRWSQILQLWLAKTSSGFRRSIFRLFP